MTDKKTGIEILIETSEYCESFIEGDFKVVIKDNRLFIHKDTLKAFEDMNLKPKNLLEFISYLQTFPYAIDKNLGWQKGSTRKFYDSWKQELKQYISDEILNFVPEKRAYGALNQKNLSRND